MIAPVPGLKNSECGDSIRGAIVPSPDRKPIRSDALLSTPGDLWPKNSAQGKFAEGALRGPKTHHCQVVTDDQGRASRALITTEEREAKPASPRLRHLSVRLAGEKDPSSGEDNTAPVGPHVPPQDRRRTRHPDAPYLPGASIERDFIPVLAWRMDDVVDGINQDLHATGDAPCGDQAGPVPPRRPCKCHSPTAHWPPPDSLRRARGTSPCLGAATGPPGRLL